LQWNWDGMVTAAALVGLMHVVAVNPVNSATVYGSANSLARSLSVGAADTAVVTLPLEPGLARQIPWCAVHEHAAGQHWPCPRKTFP
jgi:hypothetical protein